MTGEASQQQRRQDDTRRKIIAGALALEPAEANADFAAELAIGTSPDRRTAPLFDFLRDRTPDSTVARDRDKAPDCRLAPEQEGVPVETYFPGWNPGRNQWPAAAAPCPAGECAGPERAPPGGRGMIPDARQAAFSAS